MSKNKLTIGVDIGGSKINLVIWNGRKIISQIFIEKPTIVKLKQEIERFADIKTIGIGVPGVFDTKTGQIINCPNLPQFNGFNFKKVFQNRIIRIDNDAHCFLRAEAKLGIGRGYNNILAVVFGTGIGGAIMVNGQIIAAPAGEVGHMIIHNGQSWEKLYQKSRNNSAKQTQIHALALANLINIFSPQLIILGGEGMISFGSKTFKKYLLAPQVQRVEIVPGKLGPNANAIGAVLLYAG